jgi:hypothetical protein
MGVLVGLTSSSGDIMDAVSASYISKALAELISAEFSIKMSPNESIGGYFDDETKTFSVRTGKDFDIWFPTFIHEYCHFLQWRENKFRTPLWDKTCGILDDYVDDNIELPK